MPDLKTKHDRSESPDGVPTAEQRAAQLLDELGIARAPVGVDRVARRLGLEVELATLGDDVSGVLVVQDGRGVIGVSENQAPTRQRFTIAHEIGHYILHRDKMPVFIDKQFLRPYLAVFRDSASSTGEDLMEREANAFAAALLMPLALIQKAVADLQVDLADDEAVEVLANSFE